MMIRRVTSALCLAVLVASACSSGEDSDTSLDGTEWVSTSVRQNGEPLRLANGTAITLGFSGEMLQARAGCNSIGGTFQVNNDKLQTSDLFMTEMGCDEERHAQDDFVVGVLTSSPTITIDGDTLRLETPDAAIEFIDDAVANPDLAFEGTTWGIDGFLSGGTASAFATDTNGTMRFDGDVLQLFDGCADVELPIEIEGNEIRFQPVGMTQVDDCNAPPGYRQSIFTAFSSGALEYSIDGASMTLATRDNVGFTLRAIE